VARSDRRRGGAPSSACGRAAQKRRRGSARRAGTAGRKTLTAGELREARSATPGKTSAARVRAARYRHPRSGDARPVPRPRKGRRALPCPSDRREPGTGKELFARAASSEPARRRAVRRGQHGAIPASCSRARCSPRPRQLHRRVADRRDSSEQANRGRSSSTRSRAAPEHQSKLLRVPSGQSFYPGRRAAGRPPVDSGWSPPAIATSSGAAPRAGSRGSLFPAEGARAAAAAAARAAADVPLLAARFVREPPPRSADRPCRFLNAALAALERTDWPGNARELQNCPSPGSRACRRHAITVADFRPPAREPSSEDSAATRQSCHTPPARIRHAGHRRALAGP